MFNRYFKIFIVLLLALCSGADKNEKMTNYMKRTGAKFLQEVSKRPGIYTLKSGMLIEIMKSSDNPNAKSPTKFDTCEVTYSGTLKDGTPFDSGTTSFSPTQVIKGWTEAMQLMVEEDKWKLYIPYDLAYGERGSGQIPGYAPLVFEIEIHKVKSTGGKSKEDARNMFQEALASLTSDEL